MQTGSSGTLIGWKSGQTTFVPLWVWMEGAWLWTLDTALLFAVDIDEFPLQNAVLMQALVADLFPV